MVDRMAGMIKARNAYRTTPESRIWTALLLCFSKSRNKSCLPEKLRRTLRPPISVDRLHLLLTAPSSSTSQPNIINHLPRNIWQDTVLRAKLFRGHDETSQRIILHKSPTCSYSYLSDHVYPTSGSHQQTHNFMPISAPQQQDT